MPDLFQCYIQAVILPENNMFLCTFITASRLATNCTLSSTRMRNVYCQYRTLSLATAGWLGSHGHNLHSNGSFPGNLLYHRFSYASYSGRESLGVHTVSGTCLLRTSCCSSHPANSITALHVRAANVITQCLWIWAGNSLLTGLLAFL